MGEKVRRGRVCHVRERRSHEEKEVTGGAEKVCEGKEVTGGAEKVRRGKGGHRRGREGQTRERRSDEREEVRRG